MNIKFGLLLSILGCVFLLTASCQKEKVNSVSVPIILDHNRMLLDAQIQRQDGGWRIARLWIDTGNPTFFISEALARDLGIDMPADSIKGGADGQVLNVPPPVGVRIGGMPLDFTDVESKVIFQPQWLFSTMHNDANLPSTVLKKYHVIFDYPRLQLTLAQPGSLQPQGERVSASVHPHTGIVQMDAVIGEDSLSFALDNGASYSFISDDLLARLSQGHPDWQQSIGALGCANIWGWWPQEEAWSVLRVPEMHWGAVRLADVGIVGLPKFAPNGPRINEWYSRKTARPVVGILGPNAFKAFRIEVDYANSAVYFEKEAEFDSHDMDIVGLTLRPMADGSYRIIGVAEKDGVPAVNGVILGDVLLQIGDIKATGATMGTVVDALRGTPGEALTLMLERNGKQFKVEALVIRFL